MLKQTLQGIDFDMFKLRDCSGGQELQVTLTCILQKENLFSDLHLRFDTLVRFANKISSGYINTVHYHNKTHGADTT
jgi:hypothetical protein